MTVSLFAAREKTPLGIAAKILGRIEFLRIGGKSFREKSRRRLRPLLADQQRRGHSYI
jgi:hypothetical protein